jgi:hypothetical protein
MPKRKQFLRRGVLPCETDPGGCFIQGRGWFSWEELHDLAEAMMARFDALPIKQQRIYKDTGQIE